jgi:hypothetical protein
MHHLREHDFMGRFGKGHGRSDALDAAQLNPLEQVRALVRERWRLDEVVVENRSVEIADGPIRDVAQHGLALDQVILVTVTKLTYDSGIQGDTVPPLHVNDTVARRCARDHLDRNPHLRMLWQLWQWGEGLEDAGLIDCFNRDAHPYALLV